LKTYLARVQGVPDAEDLRALSEGVDLDGRRTAPARVEVERRDPEGALLRIAVHEGRKRQIKRMCREVGHPVQALERVSFGGLTAAGLEPGAWRYLTPDEIVRLKRMVGLRVRTDS
jgi:pseudouridine synthase